MAIKKIKTILCDMDDTLVEMIPTWVERYNEASGDGVKVKDIVTWDIRKYLKYPEILDKVLESSGFFRRLPIMPQAQEYLQKLMDEGFEVVIVTQPPRKADWAIRDKRCWMKDNFPNFPLENMIFAHKKYLIRGDLIFDDRAETLKLWKEVNPGCITATISYPYNMDNNADWKFSKENAWKRLYNNIIKYNNR